MSKAFDKVWHEGLLFKLKQNGVSGKLLEFFQSYLTNRMQRVALNGFYSEFAQIESGVPQGSVLGPLLFLVYINDLETNIRSNVKFFADDTMLYSIVDDPCKSAADLNHDLEIIEKWAYQWKMAFNPDPNKQANEILFSCKQKQVDHPPLFFNGSPVKRVTEQKHLGLIVQPNLSFEKHINEKLKKAKKNIGIIKHLNRFLPFKTLVQMYYALSRSHVDYCDIIYHLPETIHQPPGGVSLKSLMEKVEKVQYLAGLAITGAWKGTDRIKLYEELGWESLSDRRKSRRILQFHKIIDHATPSYLRDKLPPNWNVMIPLPNVFQIPRIRPRPTERYLWSFFPNATANWNHIILDFEDRPSYTKLKSHLISLYRPKAKSIFNIHDPMLLRYLFQLRLGLSKLRYHKKRHGFNDTVTDKCLCNNGIEDTHHYLLVCPLYTNHRVVLKSEFEKILHDNDITEFNFSVDLFLYGHSSLECSDNMKLLTYTLQYIKNTNRLTT